MAGVSVGEGEGQIASSVTGLGLRGPRDRGGSQASNRSRYDGGGGAVEGISHTIAPNSNIARPQETTYDGLPPPQPEPPGPDWTLPPLPEGGISALPGLRWEDCGPAPPAHEAGNAGHAVVEGEGRGDESEDLLTENLGVAEMDSRTFPFAPEHGRPRGEVSIIDQAVRHFEQLQLTMGGEEAASPDDAGSPAAPPHEDYDNDEAAPPDNDDNADEADDPSLWPAPLSIRAPAAVAAPDPALVQEERGTAAAAAAAEVR